MSKLEMIKIGARIVVGVSTSFTVKEVIANNLTDPETTAQACKMAVGTVMIGAMAAEASRGYIDDVVDTVAGVVQRVKDSKVEVEVHTTS